MFKHRCIRKMGLGIVALNLLFSPYTLQAVEIKLKGVDKALADNIHVYLATLPALTSSPSSRQYDRIYKQITQAMQALGYFEPDIDLSWDDDKALLSGEIEPGPPMLLEEVDINISGEGSRDANLLKLIDASGLDSGETLHQGRYETLKSGLVNQALTLGYFDARLIDHEINVSLASDTANLKLLLDSGIHYHFGEILYEGDTMMLDKVEKLRSFEVGDLFDNSQLGLFSQNLSDTGYFQSVLVSPLLSERDEGAVPIKVSLTAPADNQVELGGGFSTDVGIRGQVQWTKPRVNSAGHSLSTGLALSQVEQSVDVSYKIPIGHPLKDFYSVELGAQRTDNDDSDSESRLLALNFKRQWVFSQDWVATRFIRFELEDDEDEDNKSFMSIPGVSFARSRSEGGLSPYWGDQQLLSFEFADTALASDARMGKVRLRSKWLRSINKKHKFIWRGDLGAIASDSFEDIPSSLRFYTGGDQTIRGFDYDSISPTDEDGDLDGGRYLVAGSVEYNYPISNHWSLATFIDAGTATDDFSESLSVGTGVGLRWITPVGPLKVDLAFAVSEEDDPVKLHITLGPDI